MGFDDTVSDGVRVGILHPGYATRQDLVDTVLVATTVRLKESEMPLFERHSKVDKRRIVAVYVGAQRKRDRCESKYC